MVAHLKAEVHMSGQKHLLIGKQICLRRISKIRENKEKKTDQEGVNVNGIRDKIRVQKSEIIETGREGAIVIPDKIKGLGNSIEMMTDGETLANRTGTTQKGKSN